MRVLYLHIVTSVAAVTAIVFKWPFILIEAHRTGFKRYAQAGNIPRACLVAHLLLESSGVFMRLPDAAGTWSVPIHYFIALNNILLSACICNSICPADSVTLI